MGEAGRPNPRTEGRYPLISPSAPSVIDSELVLSCPLPMSRRILCKFFAHGACLKGEYCEFSHDWKDPPNNVCTFYQKGVCSYGNRCRYDHVKVSPHLPSASSSSSSSSNFRPYVASDSVQITHLPVDALNGEYKPALSVPKELSASSEPFLPPGKHAWTQSFEQHPFPENQGVYGSMSVGLADLPICSFAAAGNCPHGEKCPHIHGDLCFICGKHCLHPHRPDEREEHIKLCQKNNKRLEALKHSQDIECSVCLDRVLSKPTSAERKFGLLSECDHPFCISCIRNWRSNSPASGMDLNNALRACPICRKVSYFVIPSVIWYSTKEEKQEIVDNYKAKLKSIDCKYFDFGNGTCPFGTSCFYRHTYKPHAKRPPNFRPCTYKPRQLVVEEEEIENLVRGLVIEEELGDLDTEEIGSLLGLSSLLMQLGFNDWDSSSDDEN